MRTLKNSCTLNQSQSSSEGSAPNLLHQIIACLLGLVFGLLPHTVSAQPPVTPVPEEAEPEDLTVPDNEQGPEPPKLPSNFQLPPPKPELMELHKELVTKQDLEHFVKIERDYKTAMRNGVLNSQTQSILSDGIQYRVLSMSLLENRNRMSQLRNDLLLEVRTAAKLANPRVAEQFREFVLKEIAEEAEKLLDNNFYVRLNAVVLLSQLNSQEANRSKQEPEIPYTGSAGPLLSVLKDPEQPQAVKIVAAKGLGRISGVKSLKPDMKLQIALTLAQELAVSEYHYWYQMRLADAIGNVDVIYDRGLVRKPFVVDILMKTMLDPKRHWMVRAEAAQSLGQVPLDRDINVSLIAYEIARLADQMAAAQRSQPGGFWWKQCFLCVYLAFQPVDDDAKAREVGLITKVDRNVVGTEHGTMVKDAYKNIHPIVAEIINAQQRTALQQATVAPLSTWVKQTPPPDNRLTPETDPITRTAAPTSPATTSTTSN